MMIKCHAIYQCRCKFAFNPTRATPYSQTRGNAHIKLRQYHTAHQCSHSCLVWHENIEIPIHRKIIKRSQDSMIFTHIERNNKKKSKRQANQDDINRSKNKDVEDREEAANWQQTRDAEKQKTMSKPNEIYLSWEGWSGNRKRKKKIHGRNKRERQVEDRIRRMRWDGMRCWMKMYDAIFLGERKHRQETLSSNEMIIDLKDQNWGEILTDGEK